MDLTLPVRIEVREKVANAYLRFTLPAVTFSCPPSAKDMVEFRYAGWAERELAEVQYVYHACGTAEGRGAVIFALISAPDHGAMLLAFDKFKDSTGIVDLETSDQKPPDYYRLYRLIFRLWGRTTYDHGTDCPQAIGGLIRAAFLAVGLDDQAPVEALHRLLIEDRKQHGGQLSLLRLLLAWDRQTGKAEIAATAEEAATLSAVSAVFSKIKSIRPEQFPLCLRRLDDIGRRT